MLESSKNWRSTPASQRSAKNDAKCVKKTHHRCHKQSCWKRRTRLCCTTGMSTVIGDERYLSTSTVKNPVVAQRRVRQQPGPSWTPRNRDIDHEEGLQLRNLRSCNNGRRLSPPRPHRGTARPANPTSITRSMYCN